MEILPDEERYRMLGEQELSSAAPSPEAVIATAEKEEQLKKLQAHLEQVGYKEKK